MAGAATAGPVPKKDTVPYQSFTSDYFQRVPVQQDYNNVYYRTFESQTAINNTDVVVFDLPRMANTQANKSIKNSKCQICLNFSSNFRCIA